MAKLKTAGEIVNAVALEVGLPKQSDPFSTQDESFEQIVSLLNSSGADLVYYHQWEILEREYSFTTKTLDLDPDTFQETYRLPADFGYMIDQTGWMRAQNVPLAGPLSPQDWQYLKGRNLLSSTIYASFRQTEGTIRIFSNGPVDEPIAFEYMSNEWAAQNGTAAASAALAGRGCRSEAGGFFESYTSECTNSGDVPLYPAQLLQKYVKARFMGAKGFATDALDAEFKSLFDSMVGVNSSAPKINAARNYLGYPYLDGWRNLPDTGYGNKPII